MILYSIGHSNAEIGAFIELLQRHEIALLVDTRSQPYSRYTPHFNREALKQALAAAGVAYAFLGDSLGGRPSGKEFYFANGKVDYERLAEAPFYRAGVERLIGVGEECRTAFMCSEADYKHCHRYWLITRTLVEQGIEVRHILHAGDARVSTKDEFEPEQPSLF